jgi:hypothetical protein
VSAGFRLDGEVYWGTNGTVEVYLERLAEEAAHTLGEHHPWVGWLRGWREAFYRGAVVGLDEILGDHADRRVFATLWDHAPHRLLAEHLFTEHGRRWVAEVGTALRQRLD